MILKTDDSGRICFPTTDGLEPGLNEKMIGKGFEITLSPTIPKARAVVVHAH